MAYLGRYQLGELVTLTVSTVNAAGSQVRPTVAPLATIYAAGTKVESIKIPITDSIIAASMFLYRLGLGPEYSTGPHTVTYTYTTDVNVVTTDRFEIVPDGDPSGRGISMAFFRSAVDNYILLQNDDGNLRRFKNPSVE